MSQAKTKLLSPTPVINFSEILSAGVTGWTLQEDVSLAQLKSGDTGDRRTMKQITV